MTRRGLAWAAVRATLDAFQINYEIGPYGFTVLAPVVLGYRNEEDSWRLRCGSGIAGRSGSWMIVRVTDGVALSATITTLASLRRALREHLAGQHPDPAHRARYYATKHATRFESGHYIWKIKRWANR